MTITSYLQSYLGNDYDVQNFAEPGWVSTQELLFLMEQLAEANIPDIVIFYDGVNDSFRRRILPHRQVTTEREVRAAAELDHNAIATIDMYEAVIKQARALGEAYGFDVYFFWQPNLLSQSRSPIHESEERCFQNMTSLRKEGEILVYREAKQRLSNRERDGLFFLGNILDELDGPIYVDCVHLGPRGNETVAKAIYERLQL
jgi:hypothetical protein